MKKLNFFSIILVIFVSSFFFVNKVEALIGDTDVKTNTFSIAHSVNYTVIHKQMDLNGETYTTVETGTFSGEVGEAITPAVNSYTGFISPEEQTHTITLNGDNVITYLYEREQYTLTIENEEYVNTYGKPSGTYYYGTQIHLLADEEDSRGLEFVQWSDGDVYREKTFVLTEDVTLRPQYGNPYIITFDPDGGSPAPSYIERYENEALGTLPVVKKDDCVGTVGSYSERGCTYFYKFEGWYSDSQYTNQVNEDFVPNADMTIYAKWNKVYYHNDQTTFVGNNMLDSEIALFSQENADKDFIVTFTLDSMDANQGVGNEYRAALFANIDERANPYAGSMFRWDRDNNRFEIVANAGTQNNVMGGRKTSTVSNFGVGQTFVLTREKGKLYYSVDGGATFTLYNDFSTFSHFFNATATFGGEYNANMAEYRFFKGTMSNMTVELSDAREYTVHFDSNGGTGMMIDQHISLNDTTRLTANSYSRHAYAFKNWNTEPDGSGTTYTDKQQVSKLAGLGETITLYAQWEESPVYYIEFDSNGGSGSMDNQEIPINGSQLLNPSQFTKTDYIFDSWNTEPDGSGTRYEEQQSVSGLSNVPESVVTLYAQYGKREYHYNGQITFNGSSDYIDTEVNLYSAVNIDKDFDISFDVIYVDPANRTNGQEQPTLMSAKVEDYNASVVPGFTVRLNNNSYDPVSIAYKWGSVNNRRDVGSGNVPIHYEFKRRNGAVTVKITYGTNTVEEYTLFNQNNWELDSTSPTNVIFGAMMKNRTVSRYFMGTLADIHVKVYD